MIPTVTFILAVASAPMSESNSGNAALCSSMSSPELNGASGPAPRKGEPSQEGDGAQTGNAASESSSDTGVSTNVHNTTLFVTLLRLGLFEH